MRVLLGFRSRACPTSASAVADWHIFTGAKVGTEGQAHAGVQECQGIRATGNVGQILCAHREAEEKAHCPGYLEQGMIRCT